MPFYYTASTWAGAGQSAAVTTAVTSTLGVWNSWIDAATTSSTNCIWAAWTADEIEARRQELREFEEKRKASGDRASALLLHYLDERQRADLAAHRWFLVDGKSGVRYRIKRGDLVGNIEVLNPDGSVRHRLCGHDRQIGLPLDDQLLAQKFYLEHHEDEFLRIANRH